MGFDTPGYDKAGTADPGLVKDLLRCSPDRLTQIPDSKLMNHHNLDIYMEVTCSPMARGLEQDEL